MEKFTIHTGVAAPILRINVDTDAIIPSREMKKVSKLGLGEGLFAAWRYTEAGGREPNPEFVLNKSAYANTTIILSGVNFGCGSSREHAVWALTEYGIRCIIAPSFGAIFYQNCVRNGILPVMLADDAVKQLAAEVETAPQQKQLIINLENQTVIAPSGKTFSFEIEDDNRNMLINGWDAIGLTLSMSAQISNFEQRDKKNRPWAYLD
jgi:3-isopropylmalate/(R)-2-methylmalate dehydratase small subunit